MMMMMTIHLQVVVSEDDALVVNFATRLNDCLLVRLPENTRNGI